MVLLAYDPETGRLELVDPKTGGPPLLEEKPRKEATRPKVPAKKKAAKRLGRRRGAARCGRGSPGGDRIVGTHEQMTAFRNGSRRGTHISAGTTRRAFCVWGRASRGWLLLAARLPCRILWGSGRENVGMTDLSSSTRGCLQRPILRKLGRSEPRARAKLSAEPEGGPESNDGALDRP